MKNFDASVKRLTNLVIVAMLCLCPVIFADCDDGPEISNLIVDPEFNNGYFTINATATDECTAIESAEYFLGYAEDESQAMTQICGNYNNVYGDLLPVDGDFNETEENLTISNAHYDRDGVNWVCVRAQDNATNSGECLCEDYRTDNKHPGNAVNVHLEEESNPSEYLICGRSPLLSAKVCDDQSNITGGEYFLNGNSNDGVWMTASENWWEETGQDGYYCANISVDVNTTDLIEGTHSFALVGVDWFGNWNKILDWRYSFIKDTTAPKTEKVLIPYDGKNKTCDFTCSSDSINFTDCQTVGGDYWDGCQYVKNGTNITLTAYDYNPDDDEYNNLTGEYAGDVVIHYIVWWKENASDTWESIENGTSATNGAVTITLDQDSYHMIEYWAVDGCGWNETHHFELDIVDTKAPNGTKIVGNLSTKWYGPTNPDLTSYPEIIGKCWSGEEDSIDCWKVTLDTPISMKCVDPDPHPVGEEEVCFKLEWNKVDKTESYCGNYSGATYNRSGDGFCCVPGGKIEEFYFSEECEHNLKYYCIDALGNKGEIDDEKFKVAGTMFEIQLNHKWNLISVPFVMLDGSINTTFANIANKTISIWTYDTEEDTWLLYTPGAGPDTLTEMVPGWGYWVLMNEKATLEIGGELLSDGPSEYPDRRLVKGWNMIGYFGTDGLDGYYGPNTTVGKSAGCVLSNFETGAKGWTTLYSYWEPYNPDPGQWNTHHSSFEGLNALDKMDPGAGYILYLNTDGLYTYTTVC